jgi:ATPase subunit of ABC transporter with duplicated ATPase domains
MPQNYEEMLDPDITPVEFLTRDGSKEESVVINNRLASLRFTPEDMRRKIKDLSGGQKGKLLLLSLTLSGADILLLDEPTRNFSPLSGPVIRKMLAGFSGAIISVSHDRKYIDEVPEKVYELTQNRLSLLR